MDLEGKAGLKEQIPGTNPETLEEDSPTFHVFFQNIFATCAWKIQRPHSPLSCRKKSLEGVGPFIRHIFYSVLVNVPARFQVLQMQHGEKINKNPCLNGQRDHRPEK